MLSEALDQHLLDLAWSLWTELGVAGVHRKHSQFLISLEELILFTASMGEADPRLREEALDWCSRYHHFISVSRLKTLANAFGNFTAEPLSIFSASLNSAVKANWPLLTPASPFRFKLSEKSKSPRFENPALLQLRLRALFGVGARADLILFFLTQKEQPYAISDTIEIGYTKRNLAGVLESFVQAGIFEVSLVRNQQRYRFTKRDALIELMSPIPQVLPSWRDIFEIALKLRGCIRKVEKKSDSTKIVELRNLLTSLENPLKKNGLIPPPFQSDFPSYWKSLTTWILKTFQALAEGHL